MDAGTRTFITVVLAADLMAVVYFGGRYLATGHILEHKDYGPKIVVEGANEPLAPTVVTEVEVFDLASYIPDVAKGARVAAKCKACHGFDEGGRHKTGPNLWGIYNQNIAHFDDYSYSGVLAGMSDKVWDETELHAFLEAPKKYAPGTKMQYNGIRKPDQRADLIAWLKTLQ